MSPVPPAGAEESQNVTVQPYHPVGYTLDLDIFSEEEY